MPLVNDNQRLKNDLKSIKQKEMMLMDQNEALELELRASRQTNLKQMAERREQQAIVTLKSKKNRLDEEGSRLMDMTRSLNSDLSGILSQEGSVFVSNSSVSALRRPLDNSNESLLAESIVTDSQLSRGDLLSLNRHL